MALTYNFLNPRLTKLIRPASVGLFLLFVMIFNDSMANNYRPQIIKIDIIGLEKTKNFIVEREIAHPLNVKIDSILADLDRNRIFNLGLFENVVWRLIPLDNDKAILQFIMIESVNRSPPLIFPSFDEERGWSLNGIFLISNFQGKNRTIEVIGSLGGQEKLRFLISDPWIFGNHVSFSAYVENNSYEHLFLDRDINIKNIKFGIGKWYGENVKIKLSSTLISKNFINSDDTLGYNYFSPELSFDLDTRDIFWNPKRGIRVIQSIIPMVGENSFYMWKQSYSIYMTIFKNTTLAMNASVQLKHGYKSDNWISYFGNSNDIRGWKLPEKGADLNHFRFGHEYIFSSFELRRFINTKSRSSIIGISRGMCVVLFVDGGMINNNWNELDKSQLMGGAGFGVRIPIPVLQSLRIDVGWGFNNEKFNKKHAIHFTVQQKF